MRKIKDWLFDTFLDLMNRHYGQINHDIARDKNVKIFVIMHKPVELPNCFADKRLYIPFQAGSAKNPRISGALHDDVGDNISQLNINLNEMTGIYWIGRHYEEVLSPEYVGFMHYRRFLEWDPNMLEPGIVFASSYLFHLPVLRYFKRTGGSVIDAFNVFLAKFKAEACFAENLDIDRYSTQHLTYCCNMFITDKNTFMRYHRFICQCIELCVKLIRDKAVDVSGPRFEDKRCFGFVLEFMTGYWIWHEENLGRIRVRRACKRMY
ncbi:MAG: DUF4422 domain-containing protein [Kiritimatiellae bacterium]|nr:DUF4422 domain-containing protein [Kiritimatiellia bacterium]